MRLYASALETRSLCDDFPPAAQDHIDRMVDGKAVFAKNHAVSPVTSATVRYSARVVTVTVGHRS